MIITTRQHKVAEVTRTFPIHKLEPLSHEDCWSLLSKHAFRSEDLESGKYRNLEAIGRKIAKKCGGLPIAAKTLGGLLRSKVHDTKEWSAILNSNIWNLPNDDILPALLLSYQYLPSHLKRCFAYCSIFPKDYPLDRKQLVLLWVAEGFFEHSQGEKAVEEVGDGCFAELLSRSLIQQSNVDRDEFVMHDLVSDLATFISGKSCSRLEFGGNISENIRHLSYNQEVYDTFNKFETFFNFKCLRSFLPIATWWQKRYLSNRVVDDLLPKLKSLRVLSLSSYINITMLPDSIGSLVLLRYLDLSETGIKNLPDTICNLHNLQTLILSQCENFTELPIHIGKLVNLRHLDISGTNIEELPMQIVGLENLQTLTIFVVGKREVGLSIRELGRFPNLHGKLTIKNLHNVVDANEVNEVNLKSKEDIENLRLEWGEQIEDSQTVKDVLDMLKPSINLKRLTIDMYGGTSFPIWLGDSSYSNMVYLCISNCKYCFTLPPLGQLPSLKYLEIDGMTMLETVGPEFYGMAGASSNSSFQPFPSLKELDIRNMPNWKEWLPFGGDKSPFPCLKTLWLCMCPKLAKMIVSSICLESLTLESLPCLTAFPADGLPTSLQELWISKCENLEFLHPETWSNYTSFLSLMLWDSCDALTSFPLDGFPKLQSLTIWECRNLESIFLISESSSISPSTLQSFDVVSCEALRSVPHQIDTLTTLEELSLCNLPQLELSFCERAFLPPKLRSISIVSVRITRPLITEWGLQGLDNLSYLSIGGDDIVKTLVMKERLLLPISLVSLRISDLSEMKSLEGTGLRHLSSLRNLEIHNCLWLESLPEDAFPSSLETLEFLNCERLESLPKDSLPSSLKLLSIRECPLLEERYGRERGENWSNIAHIPVVKINDQVTI